MAMFDAPVYEKQELSFAADLARGALLLLWTIVRLPALALLAILWPIVCFVLVGFATLVALTAFFWEFAGPVRDFPFWTMLGISVSCYLLLIPYYALMRLLSR